MYAHGIFRGYSFCLKQPLSKLIYDEFKDYKYIMDDVVLTKLISFIEIDYRSIKSRSFSYTYFVFKRAASTAVI